MIDQKDNNRIIALFMGGIEDEMGWEMAGKLYPYKPIYDTSWSDLMPVWYRFRDLRFDNEIFEMEHSQWKSRIAHKICWGQTTDAFIEMAEGIKWLNALSK